VQKSFNKWRSLAGVLALGASIHLGSVAPAGAQSIVRDAETEAVIRNYVTPIIKAAGLEGDAVRVYLVNDDSFNAFVSGGQNIFINTGLITRVDSPRQLKGVIAHETGHIAGGHLARSRAEMESAAVPVLLSYLVGLAAMAAGGGEAGMAIIAGGMQIAQRSMLQYSRTQEASADQAAVNYLEANGESPAGLLETMQKLAYQEVLTTERQDPYVRSHPLSRDRIGLLEERVNKSPYKDRADPPGELEEFKIIQAKIRGFLEDPGQVFRKYPEKDQSEAARYARAVAYHKIPDTKRALALVDGLIKDRPQNPFYRELKGQILFETGKINEALDPYRRSIDLMPESPLLKVNLGQALVATENPQNAQEAIRVLTQALRAEEDSPMAWHSLAIAYDTIGNRGMAELATAKRAAVAGQIPDAVRHAVRASEYLPKGTPQWIQAMDIANMRPERGPR